MTRMPTSPPPTIVKQRDPGARLISPAVSAIRQVRNRGTIGGSIANNDPAADYPAACSALDATVITNKRKIAADDFFTGLFETALEPGEIVTAVELPDSGSAPAT